MRGRKPAPTAEKLAKGETRPSRVNYQEPDVPPAPADLEPPKDLKGAGLELWRTHFAQLQASGHLRATHVPLFARHCKTASRIEGWEKELSRRGLDRAERMKIERILGELENRFLRECAELAVTPASQSKAKSVTKPPVEKPKHDRFFGGIRGVIAGGRK